MLWVVGGREDDRERRGSSCVFWAPVAAEERSQTTDVGRGESADKHSVLPQALPGPVRMGD